MDETDNADGSLDPRIQIELENLNDATDDINKLETELDEAHTAFGQLLSETTKRLMEITNKLGNSCIEKARCYYDALEEARQAQIKCQQQAQLFQRASEIHAAAKETVALAESRFVSHQHEWNFDQAWQDMLNHATIKVMDAENQKAECRREHYRRAILCHDAEKRLLELEEKHRRSIIKARPYFEIKAQCDQMLATQKERVECLQKAIQDAKSNYATSLRTLEEISNQIHQQRRDYDFIANGPREPGVGAELVSPQKTCNYDMEFSQLNSSRIKDITNKTLNKFNRIEKYNNACQLQEDSEHLGKRSVDGSEATSSQWELELQVSMENLNNLSLENSVHDDNKNGNTSNLSFYTEEYTKSNNFAQELSSYLSQNREVSTDTSNPLQLLSKNVQNLQNPLVNISLLKHIEESNTVQNDIEDSLILNKCKNDFKSSTSKSLSSSPVKINICKSNLESTSTGKVESRNLAKRVPNNVSKLGFSSKKSRSNSDINLSVNTDTSSIEKYQSFNDILDNKTDNLELDKQVRSPKCDRELLTLTEIKDVGNNLYAARNLQYAQLSSHGKMKSKEETQPTKIWSRSISSQFLPCSASSSPIKFKHVISSLSEQFESKITADDSGKYPVIKTQAEKKSNINELPLLSLFEKANSLANSEGKSNSMINLNEKQNFAPLDNLQLRNIKTVSAERLANLKDNLCLRVPRDVITKQRTK